MKKYLKIISISLFSVTFLCLFLVIFVKRYLQESPRNFVPQDIEVEGTAISTIEQDKINNYLKSIKSDLDPYDPWNRGPWNRVEKRKKKILIVDFSNNNKQVSFAVVDNDQKLNGYLMCNSRDYPNTNWCLMTSVLSSSPIEYMWDFARGSFMGVSKECASNTNDIGKKCVCDAVVDSLRKSSNERFESIIYDDLNWVTEEIKNTTILVRKEFNKMSPVCTAQEVFIVTYASKLGVMKLVVTLDDEILGFLGFSPTLY